jgi:hypothetical protein
MGAIRGERGGVFEGEGGRMRVKMLLEIIMGWGLGDFFYRIAINRDSLQTTATGTAQCFCM